MFADARWAIEQGLAVFPLAPMSKKPSRGTNGCLDATNEPAAVNGWPADTTGYGIHTVGLVVVDIDVQHGGDVTAKALDLPETALTVETPHGGSHRYYLGDRPPDRGTNALGPGVDLQAEEGLYVVGPGSVVRDEDGAVGHYQLVDDGPPGRWREVAPAFAKAAKTPIRLDEPIPYGKRHDAMTQIAGWLVWLGGRGLSPTMQYAVLQQMFASVEQPPGHPFPFSEAERAWQDFQAKDAVAEVEAVVGAPLDPAVDFELHRLRVRHAAAELWRVEKAAAVDVPPFDHGTLGEVLARPEEPPFRVADLVPSGGGLLIIGQRKTAKTTTKLNLAYSLITGEPFLDRFAVRPVNGTVAFLNYEVTGAQLARWADDVGLDHDRFQMINLRGRRNPMGNPEDRARLVDRLVFMGTSTLIVDPFGRAFTGTSQNDAGEVGAWLADLDRLASDIGASETILSAHAGWNGERTRGSSGLEDWADSIVTLTRDPEDEGRRFFKAIGRDVDVEEDALQFDPTTRRLTLANTGSRKAAASSRRADALLGAVVHMVTTADPAGLNVTQVGDKLRAAKVPFSTNEESRALHRAVERGLLRVEDGGRNAKVHYPIT